MNVINRKGEVKPYNPNLILEALKKAMLATNHYDSKELIGKVMADIEKEINSLKKDPIFIPEIENVIFRSLRKFDLEDVEISYKKYRDLRNYQRQISSVDNKILSLIRGTNKELNTENSNKNALLASTQRDLMAGEISKDIVKRKIIPIDLLVAHDRGSIHIHDMDYMIQPITNCCIINIEDMLQNGTVINKRKIRSPKSFQVACTVLTQIIAQIASNQYGGQSIDIADIVPFVDVSRKKIRKNLELFIKDETILSNLVENLLKQEVASGIQTINYQLNTLNTVNGQAPFVTIFMYLKSGENEDDLKMVIEEILRQRIDGLENEVGVKVTPAFPKLIYVLGEDNMEGGKFYETTKLAAVCTAKRSYPDYISEKIMKQNYDGNVFPSMGCRSFLNPWKNEKGEYQFKGRLNFGVCTINIPQVAMLSNGDIPQFYKILEERINMAKDIGILRFNHLKDTKAKTSPIHWQYGGICRLGPEDSIEPVLRNGRSTVSVGYIGLHEAVLSLIGEPISSEKGHVLALEILDFMSKKIADIRDETGLYFSLYGTPSESTAGRLCEIDAKNFPGQEVVTGKGYYTNSYHVTPSEKIDAFTKLSLEAPFQKISSGGSISYIEIPNLSNNIDAILTVMKYMYENMLYSEFNIRSDYCHVCGFDGEIQVGEDLTWECPQCGNKDQSKMSVIRRSCGYLGENFWSEGRTKDIKDRVLHL